MEKIVWIPEIKQLRSRILSIHRDYNKGIFFLYKLSSAFFILIIMILAYTVGDFQCCIDFEMCVVVFFNMQ